MTEPSVEQIAAGLTKVQIKRLNGLYELNSRGLDWASAYGDRSLHTSRATSRALLDLGLIATFPFSDAGSLTPLGLAVRSHLLSTAKDSK